MMELGVIEQKIESLGRCLARIESRLPAIASELATDIDSQDILSLNLERAVQLCIDIAAHMLAPDPAIAARTYGDLMRGLALKGVFRPEFAEKMARLVAFRNLLVHQYANVDWIRVHGYLQGDLSSLREFGSAVIRWHESQNSRSS